MYSGHGDSNYSFELLAGPVPIAGLECSSIKAGRAPILDRGLTAIPSLERGSSGCWGKRKLAQKQEQVGLPCPAGRWINEPSARAWELGLLFHPTTAGRAPMPGRWFDGDRIATAWEPGLLLNNVVALTWRYTFISPSREGSHALPVGGDRDQSPVRGSTGCC